MDLLLKRILNAFYIALGSILELKNQMIIACEQNYIDQQQYDAVNELSGEVKRMLCSFMDSNCNLIEQNK